MTEPDKRKRHWFLWSAAVLLVLAGCLFWVMQRSATARWERYLADLDKQGHPIHIDQIKPVFDSPEQNAATHLLRASARPWISSSTWTQDENWWDATSLAELSSRVRELSTSEINAIRQELRENIEVVEHLEAAAACKGLFVDDKDLEFDGRFDNDVISPALKDQMHFLSLAASIELIQGDPVLGMRLTRTLFGVSNTLLAGSQHGRVNLYGLLVGDRIGAPLKILLESNRIEESDFLRELIAQLYKEDLTESVRLFLVGDRIRSASFTSKMLQGDFPKAIHYILREETPFERFQKRTRFRLSKSQFVNLAVETQERFIEMEQKLATGDIRWLAMEEARNSVQMDATEAAVPWTMIPNEWDPRSVFEYMASEILRSVKFEAHRNLGAVALAWRAYGLDHGEWPETIEDLVPDYFDSVPIDPFTGQLFRITRDPDGGFTFISVGSGFREEKGRDWTSWNIPADVQPGGAP